MSSSHEFIPPYGQPVQKKAIVHDLLIENCKTSHYKYIKSLTIIIVKEKQNYLISK
jgi:hypothetical protein